MITIQETNVSGLYVREYVPQTPIFSRNGILFLHGYPGSQKNYDIAEHLALKGFHCYVMHYRGAWQSEGQYSLVSNYKDVELMLRYLNDKGYSEEKLSLVGASWGGFVALETFSKHSRFYKVILLAPFMMLDQSEKALQEGAQFLYSITKPSIKNYEKYQIVEDLKTIQENYNPANRLHILDGSKVLIIHGVNDTICPVEASVKLKSLFETPARLYQLEAQDHFLHTRELLYDFCYSFLKEE
ncbi:MAG: hypothetical protein A2Z91_00650 [Deltaproteobacteria bacterium GWA2_38_16]|nr:MAG: hypothetical protein A2Z91_00650 [Deltaproteobacteria bacterium GWA2_38_16]OGQ03609.1 MAG: hypothetical protein A3D19_02055 [Deltaproteobacteria bacterium RIFCSPHIGHO2_02_FULL_38_15]OGQ35023.1 MAG: hypothetical protein A3A72_07910 [Deltaproteobacteria bacterium RIFCSPLOWO2_01_FULL_38_9]HBQ21146.1 hypothetical protein [Deltaproteobacteria bacterium]